jgi:hypothetical protein
MLDLLKRVKATTTLTYSNFQVSIARETRCDDPGLGVVLLVETSTLFTALPPKSPGGPRQILKQYVGEWVGSAHRRRVQNAETLPHRNTAPPVNK